MAAYGRCSAPTLGPLEREVLEAVWCMSTAGASSSVSVRDVHERIRDRELAYTTISTVLTNLGRKGVIERTSRSGRIRYRATISRDEYSAALMNAALSYSQDHRASILHFVNSMNDSDVETLRALIEQSAGRPPDSPDPEDRPG